jgi:putative ABC transport system ATP-binding protein
MDAPIAAPATARPPAPAVVHVDGLNHYFGEGESRNQVLFNNCLDIGPGELVIMTGPSGSGKTTLLTLIGALRSIQEGSIEILGRSLVGLSRRELVELRRGVGFIFQMHNLFESLTAYENVKMAMQLSGVPRREMRARGAAMLERLGLGHRVDYKPKALSGGQRQRVAVARALVSRPKLVFADEPTAALDKESSKTVVALLKEMAVQDGASIMMVTHDNRILEYADRIVNMVDGHIVSDVLLRDSVTICEFLKTVDVFKSLTPTEITNVAEQMKKRPYRSGEPIIRQGDIGEEFYLVASGNVDVLVQGAGDLEPKRVATLGRGHYFGERALITGEPRNATIVAEGDVETYVLGKQAFQSALSRSASFKDQLVNAYFQRQ